MAGRPISAMARKFTTVAARARSSVSSLALLGGAMVLADASLASELASELPSRVLHGAFGVRLDPTGPVGLMLLGLTAFSSAIALLHLRARRLWNEHFERQRDVVNELQSQNERMALFLAAEPQVLVNWDGPDGEAGVEGEPTILADGLTSRQVTRFGDWLGPLEVSALRSAVERLRGHGEAFELSVTALSGAVIEVVGRPVVGRAIMRLRAVTGERLERQQLEKTMAGLEALLGSLKDMLDAIPQPVWLRDTMGRLVWVNAAYVRAVEARDVHDVLSRALPLLERATLDQIETSRRAGKPFRGEAQAVVAGDRRTLDIIDVLAEGGHSGGIAVDMTELEITRRDFGLQNAAHVRMLDQLPTAVVLFDQNQRMAFYNRAFNDLWQLDRAFLETHPSDSEMLDRLRADGKLPEHADFREWKLGLQQSINANETLEDVWLLPSGRSLRVVTSPSTAGGVTYLFDDITEQMHLAQNYNRLASMQGETLDSLIEGVAVFGSHGRVQLNNPAFAALLNVAGDVLVRNPHIDDVARLCPSETQGIWHEIRSAVCGMPDERITRTFEARLNDGRVLSLAISPLPEGATLMTVEDVTSTVTAARMLKERNEALESAAQLLKEKNSALEEAAEFRSDFIHNVSFELRLPLTNVIGISQMLAAGTVGPLNERQRAYTGDLIRSTDSILALINDILALTSIESKDMKLAVGGVDLRRSIGEATEGLKDRIGGAGVELELDIAPETGAILGDEGRIRQIMFNLIANAIAFSDPGDKIMLTSRKTGAGVELRISDRGSIATESGDEVEGRRRYEKGQTLRLSVVRSLVELHHGKLTVALRPDGLREVCCTLPSAQAVGQRVA